MATVPAPPVSPGPAPAGKSDPIGGRVLLEEIFYVLSKKNSAFRVRLTERGLVLGREGEGSAGALGERTILAEDIIGCRCAGTERRPASCACTALPLRRRKPEGGPEKGKDEDEASAYLYVYAYPLKKGRRGARRERTTVTLRFRSFDSRRENDEEAQRWRSAVAEVAGLASPPLSGSPRPLLVIVNPKSGSGKAKGRFQRRAASVLTEAEMPHEVLVTEGVSHARSFVRTENLGSYRGILAVGGDGIFFEVLNGIFERPDWRDVLRELPLGILPCGSGNGLARTLCHLYDEPYADPLLSCALSVVRGKTSPMHIVRVETNTQIMFSFLSVGWGLLSDIDIESERLRAIGGQRFTIWTLARLAGLRTYKGKVFYRPVALPPTSPHRTNVNISHSVSQENSLNGCGNCNRAEESCDNCKTTHITLDTKEDFSPVHEGRRRLDSWYSAKSERSAYFSSAGSDFHSVAESSRGEKGPNDNVCIYGPAPALPALTAPLSSSWSCIEGDFIMVHAGYQTHLGEDFLFAPDSKLNDGIIWLFIIKGDTSRAQLLSFLLGIGNGSHADPDKYDREGSIRLIPVSAFRIEPEAKPSHPAYITVDGELVSYGPIQAEMCSVRANIYVPSR